MKSKVTVIIFAVLLGGLTLLNLATPSRSFSEHENRYLQQAPEFSADALLSGKFTADFDTFVTDQFVFRDGWVGLKTLSELTLHRQISNGIYFAKDDYLIEAFDSIDHAQYEKNLGYAAQFAQRAAEEYQIPVSTVLVPTTSMILADKLPANAPELDQRALLDQAAETIPGFVDVSASLLAHKDEYIYYRTDHHWTSLGAAYVYDDWRGQTGQTAAGGYAHEVLSSEFYGTTYSKASLYTIAPDTITAFLPLELGEYQVDYNSGESIADSMYERSYLDVKDKYSVFLNANQPIVRIRTSAGNGRRLLVIKDSYANTFVQMALADYEQIDVIDLRYYKLPAHDFIGENEITDVLVLYSIKNFSTDTNLYFLTT